MSAPVRLAWSHLQDRTFPLPALEAMHFRMNPVPRAGESLRVFPPPPEDEKIDLFVVRVVHELAPAALARDPQQDIVVYVVMHSVPDLDRSHGEK